MKRYQPSDRDLNEDYTAEGLKKASIVNLILLPSQLPEFASCVQLGAQQLRHLVHYSESTVRFFAVGYRLEISDHLYLDNSCFEVSVDRRREVSDQLS